MFLGTPDELSRRELLKSVWPAHDVVPVIDKDRCTGCGVCAVDCPTGALTVSRGGEEDAYQLIFQQDICDGCRICGKSCPELCLKLERVIERDSRGHGVSIIFEDKISRCSDCGALLFPQAMVDHLKSKMLAARGPALPFDLCPSCRIKKQFGKEKVAERRDINQINTSRKN